MKKIFILSSLLLFFVATKAQVLFENYKNIDVFVENNKKLKNPFAGGMDAPQFSSMDLNFDGIKDLIVFDREGSRITTFLNEGIENQISYIHAPEYEKLFPFFDSRMTLVDYNGDGAEDIFCGVPGGMKVYKNISSISTGIKFELASNLLYNDYGFITIPLFVENTDIPAVLDVDGDGDIDILSFYQSIDTSGEAMYWYKNLSVENFGRIDTLVFETGKECWGRFRESFIDCRPNLQYSGGICGQGGRGIRDLSEIELKELFETDPDDPAHAGSTLLVFDANNDNKYDLLVGDITCTSMYILYNSTDNLNPLFDRFEKFFPTTHPIDLEMFPASFSLDVNNDQKKDLLIAPNTANNSNNFNNVLLYLSNDSVSGDNLFDFTTNNFLGDEMIEVGEGAFPSFVDFNNDGLMDIVIGNTGYYLGLGVYKTGLTLFENIGTIDTPKFSLVSRDWFGFSNLNISNMSVDFADLDKDGDLDMISGSIDGQLYFFRNTAGPNQAINLEFVPNYFAGVDVGNNSSPYAYDIDDDGKFEIIVGERSYNINLVSNTGTIQNPIYSITTDSLWKINLKSNERYKDGKSSVKIVKLNPNTNVKTLLVSNGNGSIYSSDQIPNSITEPIQLSLTGPAFLSISNSMVGASNAGFKIDVADINNDGLPEIISGLPQGGLYLFKNNSIYQSANFVKNAFEFTVHPNPSSDLIQINASENINRLQVFNMSGQLMIETLINNSNFKLDISQLNGGVYTIHASNMNGIGIKKFIKQ